MKLKLTILFFAFNLCYLSAQECSCVCSDILALPDPLVRFVANEAQCTSECAMLMYASSQFVGGICSCTGAPNPPDPSPPVTVPSEADCITACTMVGYMESVCGPVPVELISFVGHSNQEFIVLEWETASELENAGFEIERSMDASTWQLLDFVKGFGTTIEPQAYKWKDNSPLTGTAYYRLRQMDHDGTFDYSEVISVRFDNKTGETELIAWPNPVNSTLRFQLVGQEKYYGEFVHIYDSFGRLLKTQLADRLYLRDNQGEINVSDLASGLYFISVQVEGQIFNQKFMKH